MLDLGSTLFVISPEAANAIRIPVVKRSLPGTALQVGGRRIQTEELFTIPLGLSFGNHRTLEEQDHVFEVMKTSSAYDTLIPAWYLDKHKAQGITMGYLHCLHCSQECFEHGIIHPEYEIRFDKRLALRLDAINIGAVILDNPEVLEELPENYHKRLDLFDTRKQRNYKIIKDATIE